MNRLTVLAGMACVALASCGGGDSLHNLETGAVGPDEFSVLHQEDAAAAFVAAVHQRLDGPVNVVGHGTITAFERGLRLGPAPPWG